MTGAACTRIQHIAAPEMPSCAGMVAEGFWGLMMSAIARAITPVFAGRGILLGGAGWILVMVFVGTYFLISAQLHWKKAPAPPTAAITVDLTYQQFADLKAKLRPEIESACLRDGKAQPSLASDYCSCYAKTTVALLSKDELVHRGPSLAFGDRLETAAKANCKTVIH
jgi:hypothetical protein